MTHGLEKGLCNEGPKKFSLYKTESKRVIQSVCKHLYTEQKVKCRKALQFRRQSYKGTRIKGQKLKLDKVILGMQSKFLTVISLVIKY